eukprot:9490841-Pyramimonas_sp.AAC.1
MFGYSSCRGAMPERVTSGAPTEGAQGGQSRASRQPLSHRAPRLGGAARDPPNGAPLAKGRSHMC